MPKLITVRHLGALPGESHYEVHTPMGTWQLDMVKPSYDAGYGLAPRWVLTTPGEYNPDAQFDRKRDAVAYVTLLVNEELDKNSDDAVRMAVEAHRMELHQDGSPWVKIAEQQTTPATKETDTVTETAPRYIVHSFLAGPHTVFAVKDTVTQIDVASFYSRYAARDKRDRLNADLTARETRETQLAQEFPTDGPKCGHGFALRVGVTSSVKCEFGHEYGVFGDEGPIDRADCAMQAANDAAFYTSEDDGDTEYVVKVICPDHEDQPKDGCEDCNTEDDEEEND